MKAKLYGYITLLLIILTAVSCEDDETPNPQAEAAFTVDKTTADIGEEIQFTNTSENATAFKWSFGDGTTSKDISPKKVYTSSGTYVVTLLSTGAGGSKLSSTQITILPDPEVYFIDGGASLIRRFGISAPENGQDFLDLTGFAGVGIAYDSVNEKVYFSDFEVYGEGKIWRVNLDGTDLEEVVGGLYDPYQIALDVDGDKIYWAEDTDLDDIGHIGRANLDGSEKENVVSLLDGQFRAISLDPENNKMYYYEVWNEDLYVANLDGTEATPILNGVYGYAIHVDTKNDKIYFDEQNAEQLLRADLDGENVEIIGDNGSRIYGISIDHEKGKLYWSGRDSGDIRQANLDGSHQIAIASGLSSPRGMFFKK
jgi:DNA-binding beta-propeller fold protein YncE